MGFGIIGSVLGGVYGGIIGGAIDIGTSYLAGNEAKAGYRRGITSLREYLANVEADRVAAREAAAAYQEPGIAAGQRSDVLGTALQPRLMDLLEPKISPGYALVAREGLNQIRQQYASGGSPNSGASQLAAGRFMSGLAAEEYDKQRQTLLSLAGLAQQGGFQAGQLGLGYTGNLSGYNANIGNIYRDIASLKVGRGLTAAGQVQSMGQGFSGIATSLFK